MAWIFTIMFGKSYRDGIDFYLFLFGLSKILHDMVEAFTNMLQYFHRYWEVEGLEVSTYNGYSYLILP